MLIHVDVFVKSMDEMLEFYSGKMGMKVVDDATISGDMVRFVSHNKYDTYRLVLLQISKTGAMLELIQFIGEEKNNVNLPLSSVTISLLVLSLEEKMKQLKEKGVMPISDIYHINMPKKGASDIVFYRDTENNMIELIQMDY